MAGKTKRMNSGHKGKSEEELMNEENKEREQGQVFKKKGKKSPIAVIIIAVVLVLAVGGGIAYYAASASTAARFREQLDLGNHYLEELQYEQAVAAFETAISIDPKNEDACLGLADAYVGLGDYESAMEALEDGIAALEDDEAKADAVEELRKRLAELQAEYEAIKEAERLAAEEVARIEADEEAEWLAEETAAVGRVPYADEIAAIADASAGDIVYFGSYEQDNDTTNGTEPVTWYVLDKTGGEATLLSVYLLDCKPYHEEYTDITWENCTLRSWLNGEFYNAAFSAEEQAAIVNTNVVNEDNPFFYTESGNNTTDKVWLLSLGEIAEYFGIPMTPENNPWYNGTYDDWYEYGIYCYEQDNRVCAKPTAYAAAEGAYAFSEEDVQWYLDEYGNDISYAIGSALWWLRSPGSHGDYAARVFGFFGGVNYGGVNYYGSDVDGNGGIRPALKVAY